MKVQKLVQIGAVLVPGAGRADLRSLRFLLFAFRVFRVFRGLSGLPYLVWVTKGITDVTNRVTIQKKR